MFGLGMPELIVILIIAFLVFGGKKLPEIGSGLGKAISSFKKGVKEVEQESGANELKSLKSDIEEEVNKVKDVGNNDSKNESK